MTIPRNIKNTLRYHHLVARIQGMQPYRQEAALKAEITNGPQWRIDAAIEGINKKPANWNAIDVIDVMKHAAMYGRLQTVQKIAAVFDHKPLDRKLHPNRPAPREVQAAFHVAARHGRYRTADAMAKLGASPMSVSESATPAIYTAVEEGDLRKIDYLIRRGADKDYLVNLASTSSKYMKVTKYLVEKKGAGVNFAAQGFWTPFVNAVKYGRDDLAQYLLEHGATPQHDKSAGEALYTAIGYNNVKMVSLMLEIGFKPDAQSLHHAIYSGHIEATKVLLEKGGMTMAGDKQEALLLAIAAPKNSEALVKLALDNGADAKAALAALESDKSLHQYGNRDKMQKYLEAYLAPKAPTPPAVAPAAPTP